MSSLDPRLGEIRHALLDGESVKALAERLGVARSTLRDFIRANNLKQAATTKETHGDDDVTIKGTVGEVDIPSLMREHKLNPDEWEVTDCIINRWEGMTSDKAEGDNRIVPLCQIKIMLKRKVSLDLITPAYPRVPRKPPKAARSRDEAQLTTYLSDQHAPYHDPKVHAQVLAFLRERQPDRIVLGGDGGDYGTISKHRDNPAWNASPNDCTQGYYELCADYRDAVPDAEILMLAGNHDARLATEQLLRAERMFAIRPARKRGTTEDEDPAQAMRRLLWLDDLHIQYVGTPREGDNYEHAEIQLTPELVASHGYLTGRKPGEAAHKHLESMGQSVIFGHTHYQALVSKMEYRRGKPYHLWGIEAGCLCLVEGGLGYAKRPKWNQGFATVTTWPDGRFHPDLARVSDGRLYWRDQSWRP